MCKQREAHWYCLCYSTASLLYRPVSSWPFPQAGLRLPLSDLPGLMGGKDQRSHFDLVLSSFHVGRQSINVAAGYLKGDSLKFVLTSCAHWSEQVVVSKENTEVSLFYYSSTTTISSSSSSAHSPLPGLRAYWKPVELVDSALSRRERK